MTAYNHADTIMEDGEEPLCGISVLQPFEARRSHLAWHHRSEVVKQAAIDSSRRGDGRFLEGEATITPEQGVSFMGAMARAVKAAQDFEDALTFVRRVTGD